jgi:hypothetical protein
MKRVRQVLQAYHVCITSTRQAQHERITGASAPAVTVTQHNQHGEGQAGRRQTTNNNA